MRREGCDQTSFIRSTGGRKSAAGRSGRRSRAFGARSNPNRPSEASGCGSKRATRAARPRFQRFDCTRRGRGRQRIYGCGAFPRRAMRLFVRGLPALAFTLVAATPASPPAAPRGLLRRRGGRRDRDRAAMRAIPDAAVARETMRHLSESPHHLGSAQDGRRTPNGFWQSSRSSASTRASRPSTSSFPTPRERVLELVEPSKFRAALAETPVSGDPTSVADGRAAAVLQRLLHRRRSDGAPRLRQLRHAGRLRGPRAPRRRRARAGS